MNKKKGKLKTGTHLKTYNFKLYTNSDLDMFDKFQRLVVHEGLTVTEGFMGLVKEYVERNYPRPEEAKLVTELELRDYCKSRGINAGRSNLKKYRDMNLIVEGVMWWTNTDGNVIYSLDPVFKYLKERNKKPFSRLKPEEE